MWRWTALLLLLLLPGGLSAQEKEQSLGVVLSAQGARLLPANNSLPLTARPGDLLFAGDALLSEGGTATFLYCPEKSSQTLPAGGKVVVEPDGLRVEEGGLSDKKDVPFCALPAVERAPSASQRHYRDTLTRALEPPSSDESAYQARLQALPEAQRSALLAELSPVDQALTQNPQDQAARLARAAVLENYGLTADALGEYEKLSAAWEGTDWVRQLVHEKATALGGDAPEPEGPGQTFALLVGISKYQRLSPEQQLQFAHADAMTFAEHLQSPRGGGVPAENIEILTNEQATTAAIRAAIETFLKARAGKGDTVILFMAAHGTVAEAAGEPEAFIITYDSDPQDLASTALPMADIQNLMREQLTQVGRVLIYVDVCRAGIIGRIRNNTVNRNVEELFEEEGELFGFLASRPREYSIESSRFGGGHGAFTYFLLRALNGDADGEEYGNGDGIISTNEVIDYVREQVRDATRNRQHPIERVNFRDDPTLADTRKEGITLADWTPAAEEESTRSLQAGPPTAPSGRPLPQNFPQNAVGDLQQFDEALAAGRILPEVPGSAFDPLRRLERALSRGEYLILENRLRVALENQGQQVLLRYLEGDQIPQTRGDFASGAVYFRAAQVITSQSPLLESREAFARGRVLIFDKQYDDAVAQLEQAVRLDPNGAYSYNALGIAYLEQSDYSFAVQAFRDAARRAPYWAYPLHNMALAYTEMGDYQEAIRAYRQAMDLAPQYSYLPYNLGLVYQRLNRRRDAEAAYRQAIALSPDLAEPYNALGVLYASTGRASQAERYYREALQKKPDLLSARHNLALLLADRERVPEAVQLWRENIAQSPDHLPSRLLLAETLAQQGDNSGAIQEYQEVLQAKPDYLAARLALARLLSMSGNAEAGREQVQEVLKTDPQSPQAYEQLGDIEKAQGRAAEATAAYQQALQYAAPQDRKRIQRKIRGN